MESPEPAPLSIREKIEIVIITAGMALAMFELFALLSLSILWLLLVSR